MIRSRRYLLAALAACLLTPSFAAAEEKPNDAIVPVPREGGWVKRHESFNERVKQGNVDLLFIGDSITQGWEGAGKKVWDEFYGKRNAVNLGIGGDRTQHVLWRLDNGNIEGIQPKLAVLMIGTNNSGTNTSEQIAAGIKAIVEKLRTKLPETKVLILGVFPRGPNKEDAKRLVNEGANNIVKQLADDQHVFYLDIGPAFLADDGTLSKEIMPDLLHLNEKSYRLWAESIEPKVKELLGEK
jgi:beta-glucosidase